MTMTMSQNLDTRGTLQLVNGCTFSRPVILNMAIFYRSWAPRSSRSHLRKSTPWWLVLWALAPQRPWLRRHRAPRHNMPRTSAPKPSGPNGFYLVYSHQNCNSRIIIILLWVHLSMTAPQQCFHWRRCALRVDGATTTDMATLQLPIPPRVVEGGLNRWDPSWAPISCSHASAP